MRDRFRSFDSKISFFAFADIITAVSGMLIFITLLLATDLGRPTDTSSQSESSEIEQRLRETLSEQVRLDLQNHRLEELLAGANTAPDLEKLQTDIARLRSELSEEQRKQRALAGEKAETVAAIAERDKVLGLTELKATIQRTAQEAKTIQGQEVKARGDMANLEQQTLRLQTQLLKLRQRDGQLWLIPDRRATTKEPILVTVSATGAGIEQFDHPDQRRQLDKSDADSGFKTYLRKAKVLNQYVVFLVKPSGIGLFQDLVKSARNQGFDVGFDALEESRQVHFSNPPPIEEPLPTSNASPTSSVQEASAVGGNSEPTNARPVAGPQTEYKTQPPATNTVAPPKNRSRWQRFLDWVGFK